MKDEMDILKEIGNISAAHGSTALSEMLGRKIQLRMPSVNIVPNRDLPLTLKAEGQLICLQTQMLTGLSGTIIFMVEEKSAYKFVDICLHPGKDQSLPSAMTEMAMSIIKEIGNVVTSAYVNSLGYYLKKLVVPSLPVLMSAPLPEIMKMVVKPESDEDVITIESIFLEETSSIRGNFWLILSSDAAHDIKEACKKYLDELNTTEK